MRIKLKSVIITALVLLNIYTMFSCNIFYRKNTRITVTGTALDDKDGAIVETKKIDYLIDKVDEWPDNIYGKKVTVEGYLVVEVHERKSTAEVAVQERVGLVFIIKRPKYKVVK